METISWKKSSGEAGNRGLRGEDYTVSFLHQKKGGGRVKQGYRQVKPRFWGWLFTLFFVAALAVYCAQQRYMSRQQALLDELNAQKATLTAENEELQRKIDFTYTDEYIEREARSKLGLIREDEILFESND